MIEVAAAQSRRLERSISVTGSLVADEVVTVSPEMSGRVVSIKPIRAERAQRRHHRRP